MMATSNPESKLLRKYFGKLKDSMLSPSVLADELYSEEYIDEHVRKKVVKLDNGAAADELLSALQAYFGLDEIDEISKRFKTLLDIFKQCIPLDRIAQNIEKEYSISKF